jgi:hypothetical protein
MPPPGTEAASSRASALLSCSANSLRKLGRHDRNSRPDYENRGASKAAIQSQYDAGNAFFERLLDRTMGYSAGLWVEPARRDSYDAA